MATASLHASWAVFWLWGIHNFWHQLGSLLLKRRSPQKRTVHEATESVVILYVTCDDFDAHACESCMTQTYAHCRLIICDDSRNPRNQELVNEWAYARDVPVSRRCNRSGFKAGNLNHAVRTKVEEEFIVVCDADEKLQPTFVVETLRYFVSPKIAFVQSNHRGRTDQDSRFARILAPTIELLFQYSLPLRNTYGFVSSFGHGVMLRRSAWSEIGGIPEIVSEDIAFAVEISARDMTGVYAEDVIAEESYPMTYAALSRKYQKIIRGTVEFFQLYWRTILFSRRMCWIEKLDIVLTFTYCYLGAVTLYNAVGGVLLSYYYRTSGLGGLPFWVMLIYLVGPLTPLAPSLRYLFRQPWRWIQFLLFGAVSYVSLMPALAFRALQQTFRCGRPTWGVPAGASSTGISWGAVGTFAVGCFIGVLGWTLPSSSFVPTAGLAAMMMVSPILHCTNHPGIIGALATSSPLVPYALLFALVVRTLASML